MSTSTALNMQHVPFSKMEKEEKKEKKEKGIKRIIQVR
jgi:hypothetical protein